MNCEVAENLCKTLAVIVCFYKSQTGNVFPNKLSKILDLLIVYQNIVVVGDFNVRFVTWKERLLSLLTFLLLMVI